MTAPNEPAVSEESFCGAKIALICDGSLVAYLRDDFAHIPYPAFWDVPGGGREQGETPDECALRELFEEFGLAFDQECIIYRRRYLSVTEPGENTFFMAAYITKDDIARIRFGTEGQRWQLMPLDEFLVHDHAVPHLQERLRDFLETTKG